MAVPASSASAPDCNLLIYSTTFQCIRPSVLSTLHQIVVAFVCLPSSTCLFIFCGLSASLSVETSTLSFATHTPTSHHLDSTSAPAPQSAKTVFISTLLIKEQYMFHVSLCSASWVHV